MRTYIVREEPNLKLLNVGDLMNWKIKNKYIKNDYESKLGGIRHGILFCLRGRMERLRTE